MKNYRISVLNKTIKILSDEGIGGILSRMSRIFVSSLRKARINLKRKLLSNKEGFFYNYTNFKKDWILTRETQARIRSLDLRSLNEIDIDRIKRSNRVFILGSGSSVNDLTDKNWTHISECNSIGLNSWIAHPFVPDFYFVEPPKCTQLWLDWNYIYEKRKIEYSKVAFIINYKEWQFELDRFPLSRLPDQLHKNLFYNSPYNLRLNNEILISLVLQFWKLFLYRKNDYKYLIHQRGTISSLIMFSFLAGFTEIVLVGVDLNNTAYFFESTEKHYEYKPINVQRGEIHRTADPTLDINRISIPIDEYIYLLDKIVLKPKGISLYVASEKSRLFPKVPRYNFPNKHS